MKALNGRRKMGTGAWREKGGVEEEDGSHWGNGERTRTGERGKRGEGGVIWREPIGEKWCDESFGFDKTGIAKKEYSE